MKEREIERPLVFEKEGDELLGKERRGGCAALYPHAMDHHVGLPSP